MYEMNIQVRYSEVDRFGKVRLHQLLDYFQDCSTFHSISLGFGRTGAEDEQHSWYLLSWDVEVRRYPKLSERLKVTTEPYKMKGFYGYRRYKIFDEAGNDIAEADTIWIYMDIEKMIPAKIPLRVADTYIPEKVDETVKAKRKLAADGDWKEMEQILVSKYFLDSNMHVNNTCYVLWAEDVLPEGYHVNRVKVDYRQSSRLNDVIRIYAIEEESAWRVRFVNQDDVLMALLELSEL
ncbi:MAG: thioesterase [Clostridiales bacterium]|nr:thioesterase [Clostridiales bacterium]